MLGIDAEVVDALEELGLVRRVSSGQRRRYDSLSLKLVRTLGAARSSGLTEESGLSVSDLKIYIDRLQSLASMTGLLLGWFPITQLFSIDAVSFCASAGTIVALTALGGPLTDLTVLARIQTDFAPEHIGRVYILRVTNSDVRRGIGLVAAGPLFAGLGVRYGIALSGALLVLFAGVALARFRETRSREPVVGSPSGCFGAD